MKRFKAKVYRPSGSPAVTLVLIIAANVTVASKTLKMQYPNSYWIEIALVK